MKALLIAGVALAGLFVLSGGPRSNKVHLNALKSTPPRLRLNAMGYYIPIDEAHTEWLSVTGPPGKNSTEMWANRPRLTAMLPPGANPDCRDQYSKEFHNIPTEQGTPIQTDEYGRSACGVGGNPLSAFAGVLVLALPYVPGIGTAAAATLGAAIALGQGKSLKDAVLAAGYYAVPAHLRFAYAAGVGVASGQSIDDAALTALEHEYPGAKAAYEQGKELAS